MMYSYDVFILISLLLFNFITDTYCYETCGVQKEANNDRIVNGHDLQYPRKYPWFTALFLSNNPRQLVCGGALIHERHVLTAAHCYKPYFKSVEKGTTKLQDIYLAKLGVDNICINEPTVQVFATIQVHIHEKYYKDLLFYDIAIMVLETSITDFMPICLPFARYESNNRTNLMGTIIGLGKESSTAWQTPCTVKEAQVPLQPDSICSRMLHTNKNKKNDDVFCAGYPEGGIDTCQGDSGGPLQVYNESTNTWMILGITSFGFGCARPEYYGVYTDVSHYLDWIDDKIQYDENHDYEFDDTDDSENVDKAKNKPEFHKKKGKKKMSPSLWKIINDF